MTNLLNTEYITLDQLLDSVGMDFKKYSEAALIDKASLYKVISYCNSNAGISVNPIMYCIEEIVDGKITLPENFKKIKKINIITNHKTNIHTSLPNYSKGTEIVTSRPDKNTPLYTPFGCRNDCGECYWEIPKTIECKEDYLIVHSHKELSNGETCGELNHLEYSVDKEENVIKFGCKTGKVIICYYGDMDSLGLIPKEPMLYFYYEWSIKYKILQDILMNSDDDVQLKLQLAEKERLGAFVDFDNYIKSESFKKRQKRYIQEEKEFFDKWFAPFY